MVENRARWQLKYVNLLTATCHTKELMCEWSMSQQVSTGKYYGTPSALSLRTTAWKACKSSTACVKVSVTDKHKPD